MRNSCDYPGAPAWTFHGNFTKQRSRRRNCLCFSYQSAITPSFSYPHFLTKSLPDEYLSSLASGNNTFTEFFCTHPNISYNNSRFRENNEVMLVLQLRNTFFFLVLQSKKCFLVYGSSLFSLRYQKELLK